MAPVYPRFTLVVDCSCGRRYFRFRIEGADECGANMLCACGHKLGASEDAFRFESLADRTLRQAGSAGLSPHC